MAVATTNDLKKIFFDAYDGFADKRVKNLDKESFFIVDDRGRGDYDARKELFLWFCLIFVEVLDEANIRILLRGGVPQSAQVSAWLKEHGAEESKSGITFNIERGHEQELLGLAKAFRAITRPGAKYDVKAYKYVCPRTADSIERLFKVLEGAWK